MVRSRKSLVVVPEQAKFHIYLFPRGESWTLLYVGLIRLPYLLRTGWCMYVVFHQAAVFQTIHVKHTSTKSDLIKLM